MEKRKSSSKRAVIILASLVIAMFVALTAVTVAWFTSSASFNSSITFGEVEIDTNAENANYSTLTKTVTRNIGEYLENGKVMPGDTINFNLRIKLTDTSEPAYYLVKVAGTGALSSLTVEGYYYLDETVQTATDSAKSAGVITADAPVTLNIPFVISTDFTEQGVSGDLTCTVAVIQQANVGASSSATIAERKASAYDLLKSIFVPAPIVFTSDVFNQIEESANCYFTDIYVIKDSTSLPQGYNLSLNSTLTSQARTILNSNRVTIYTGVESNSDRDTIVYYIAQDTEVMLNGGYPWGGAIPKYVIDLTALNTSSFTHMIQFFALANAYEKMNLSGWNTSNLTDVESMFSGSNIGSLDLTGWDLSNVTNFTVMFAGCEDIVITCSQATKEIIMAHNGEDDENIGVTLTDANFNVV